MTKISPGKYYLVRYSNYRGSDEKNTCLLFVEQVTHQGVVVRAVYGTSWIGQTDKFAHCAFDGCDVTEAPELILAMHGLSNED